MADTHDGCWGTFVLCGWITLGLLLTGQVLLVRPFWTVVTWFAAYLLILFIARTVFQTSVLPVYWAASRRLAERTARWEQLRVERRRAASSSLRQRLEQAEARRQERLAFWRAANMDDRTRRRGINEADALFQDEIRQIMSES